MKAVHFFLGADLRASHPGLTEQAKKKGVKMNELGLGEAVVFVNRRKNKLKAFSYNGVLSYIRFDDPKRGIDMDALNEIPRAFRPDGTLDYTSALRTTLEKKLKVKRFEKLEVLK